MSDINWAPGKRLSQIRQQLGLSQRHPYYRAEQGQPGQSYAINTGIPHSCSNTSVHICRIVSAHTLTTF